MFCAALSKPILKASTLPVLSQTVSSVTKKNGTVGLATEGPSEIPGVDQDPVQLPADHLWET